MGIYDREYYRQSGPGFRWSGPRTAIGILLLLNIALYLANALFTAPANDVGLGGLSSWLALRLENLVQPLYWWRFLTYGFIHSYEPQHLVLNMLTLWFLGRDVEDRYGRREFLYFYLATLVVASVAWAVANRLQGRVGGASLVGASGAVTAAVILFALNYPHRTLMLFFVLPVPAWFVGLLTVAMDLYGSLNGYGEGPRNDIAYSVHLAGAAFGFLYFRFGWNFDRLFSRLSLPALARRPKLRVHHDDADPDALQAEVDRILAKISEHGEASLTRSERKTLESASREYQRRRNIEL